MVQTSGQRVPYLGIDLIPLEGGGLEGGSLFYTEETSLYCNKSRSSKKDIKNMSHSSYFIVHRMLLCFGLRVSRFGS